MNDDLTKQQIRRGQDALLVYYSELYEQIINRAASENKLNFKGTVKDFKSVAKFLLEMSYGSTEQRLLALNKNVFIKNAVNGIDSFVETNKEEVLEQVKRWEDDFEIKFSDLDMSEFFYHKVMGAAKKKGLFGKNSAMAIVSDQLMEKLDVITDKAYEEFKGEDISGMSIKHWSALIKNDLKISVPGIQAAYKEGGFIGEKIGKPFQGGVVKYVIDNLVENGASYIAPHLELVKSVGIQHHITPESIKASYAKNGLFGKDGVLQAALMDAYTSTPGADQMVYSLFIQQLVTQNVNKQLDYWKKAKASFRYVTDKEIFTKKNELLQEENEKVMLAMANGVPEELSPAKIKEIYDSAEGGFLGRDGVVSYLTKNMKNLFQPAINAGLADDSKKTKMSAVNVSVPVKGEKYNVDVSGFIDFAKEFTGQGLTDSQKFAYALAETADRLGVEPSDVLRFIAYSDERKEIYRSAYGPNLEVLKKPIKNYVLLKEEVFAECRELLTDSEAENLHESIDKMLEGDLEERFFGLLLKPYVKKTFVKKAEDYLVLVEGFFDGLVQLKEAEVKLYSA